MFAAVAVMLAGGLVESGAARVYCMSEFHRYFESLGMSDARVNPVERIVFSLLLSEAKPGKTSANLRPTPARKQI